uniref:Uncharacterized protein n=1 Tax=Steinernema glaseri TaxID=37863 RepID=A0A1I8ANK9_9BILA
MPLQGEAQHITPVQFVEGLVRGKRRKGAERNEERHQKNWTYQSDENELHHVGGVQSVAISYLCVVLCTKENKYLFVVYGIFNTNWIYQQLNNP